jgi:hypothetical protein
MAELYDLQIRVIARNKADVVVGNGSHQVTLSFIHGNHYDVVRTRERMFTLALAQVAVRPLKSSYRNSIIELVV